MIQVMKPTHPDTGYQGFATVKFNINKKGLPKKIKAIRSVCAVGRDENGKIVIGEHPKLNFANRNPAFVAIQIAQAVVAKRNRNLINTNYGKANIKPEFYEMVSELVGEMPVQIASEYAGDYL